MADLKECKCGKFFKRSPNDATVNCPDCRVPAYAQSKPKFFSVSTHKVVPHEGLVCTVGPRADTGERCGDPAVTAFKTSDGELFAECKWHAPRKVV